MNYRYSGPVSGLNLPGDPGEVVLINGGEYTLPEKDDDVMRLVAQGHLTPLPSIAKAKDNKGESNAS